MIQWYIEEEYRVLGGYNNLYMIQWYIEEEYRVLGGYNNLSKKIITWFYTVNYYLCKLFFYLSTTRSF
jgi:hypothetical protein